MYINKIIEENSYDDGHFNLKLYAAQIIHRITVYSIYDNSINTKSSLESNYKKYFKHLWFQVVKEYFTI